MIVGSSLWLPPLPASPTRGGGAGRWVGHHGATLSIHTSPLVGEAGRGVPKAPLFQVRITKNAMRINRILHDNIFRLLTAEPRFSWAIGPMWRSFDVAIHLPMIIGIRALLFP